MMHQRMYHHSQGNSFSMVFGHGQYRAAAGNYDEADEEEIYSFTTSSSSPSPSPSSVDCTLSLGTPSTRLTNDDNVNTNIHHQDQKKRASCGGISNFGWNILQSSKHAPPPSAAKSNRAGGNNNADPLLARRCANCDTTSTPLWRNGPRGPKSLCNACGIRFKKEERRATAAAAASTTGGDVDTQHMMTTSNWVQAQRMGCYSSAYGNEFRFMEEDDNDHHRDSSDHSAAVPFLSWRFNVADRPAGLVHDFTR